MKKYLKAAGWKESKNNDVLDKQFYLQDITYEQGEYSSLGNVVTDRTESYILFLKNFDIDSFQTKIESILNSALNDGVGIVEAPSVIAEREENGYQLTLTFTIRS